MSLAIALEWWLKGQDKWVKPNIQTVEGKLTVWEVEGVKKPTLVEQSQIISDYEAQYTEPTSQEEEIKRLKADIEVLKKTKIDKVA